MSKPETDPTLDDDETKSRLRRLAALSGTAVGLSTAGCIGGDDGEDDEEDDDDQDTVDDENDTQDDQDDTQDDDQSDDQDDTQDDDDQDDTQDDDDQDDTQDDDQDEELPDLSELSTQELMDVEKPEYEPNHQLGMVIDLQRCVGCDTCNIACKQENNVKEGQAWAHRIKGTSGTFPDVAYDYKPNLCNHCRDAPCVDSCPTPAMNKGPGGITMQNPDACIGCWQCVENCPYGKSFKNERGEETHTRWRSDEAILPGTASPQEVTETAGGNVLPYYNPHRELDDHESPLREGGIAEKCTLCYHRVRNQELPACVEECPTNARIVGDLDDPDSTVSQLIEEYGSWRWKEDEGTEPKVHYIREFDGSESGDGYEPTKGEVPELKERHELYR